MRKLIYGFRASQCLFVAVNLGIADFLNDAPRNSAELAELTGAHPSSLQRLLRLLVSIGILQESKDYFRLTSLGTLLRTNTEGSMSAEILHMLQPASWEPWGQLLHSIRTNQPAFVEIFGMDPWSYRAEHSDSAAIFDSMATGMSQRESDAILKHLDFSTANRIVDVGGGKGAFIAEILKRYPGMSGILFDRPQVVSAAADLLKAADVTDRCSVTPGDFFDEVPGGCDLYLLKAILHDWNDEAAVAILKNCRRAMGLESRIVLLELVLDPGNMSSYNNFQDLHMLVIHGGKERTAAEYRRLLESSGLRLHHITPMETGISLIEGAPV